MALKLFGAAYLVYLGHASCMRTPRPGTGGGAGAPQVARWRLFFDGALSNVANPKIAVFYFAFLPQFVLPQALHPTLTIFVLGLLFALITFAVKGPVGWFAGRLSGWLRQRPGVLLGLYRGSGAILVGLGLRLALERRE
jgi:threonine/homoserine/homoserine lactone efflux protein